MSNYSFVAIGPNGAETSGTLDVSDQSEALRRIKEMGLFPTRVSAQKGPRAQAGRSRASGQATPAGGRGRRLPWAGRVKTARLAVFTRQLATLVEAGMPLLRGLRVLQEQEENATLKRIINEISQTIENGGSLAEATEAFPKVFTRLYVNMVKAGEIGGALEVSLTQLADFMEKAQKLKGKIKAAMFYPCAVLTVALGIMTVLMAYVVPKFQMVFDGLMNGRPLPAFSRFVFQLSSLVQHHLGAVALLLLSGCVLVSLALRTDWGRWAFDRAKLTVPVLGPLFRKAAIARFARTLGTLVRNGVPILQALTIVKETAGNQVVGNIIGRLHECVKQGEPIAPSLKASSVFPAMVAGMVDVGEQTGALPEMLMKIADNYDDEVDHSTTALTSLLEPIMIVFLAVVVGSIVIAMFMPLIAISSDGFEPPSGAHDA